MYQQQCSTVQRSSLELSLSICQRYPFESQPKQADSKTEFSKQTHKAPHITNTTWFTLWVAPEKNSAMSCGQFRCVWVPYLKVRPNWKGRLLWEKTSRNLRWLDNLPMLLHLRSYGHLHGPVSSCTWRQAERVVRSRTPPETSAVQCVDYIRPSATST